jgi:hypothetical protein
MSLLAYLSRREKNIQRDWSMRGQEGLDAVITFRANARLIVEAEALAASEGISRSDVARRMSVVECFETDGGVKYRSNRLISFYFMRLSFDAASDVFGLCCV